MAAEKKHIILVHGAGMGAWCWYKVSTALQSAGHHVTVPDLAASGIDERKLTDVTTFREYSKPLLEIMASLPVGDKVVLVGHSLGGINIALAMEEFPEKVSAAVFVTAQMPDFTSRPSYVIEKFHEEGWLSSWMDNEIKSYKAGDKLITSLSYGPQFVQSLLCQLSSPEPGQRHYSLRICKTNHHFLKADTDRWICSMLFVVKIWLFRLRSSIG